MATFDSQIEQFHKNAQVVERPLTLAPIELLRLHRGLQEKFNDDYLDEADHTIDARSALLSSITEELRTKRPDLVNKAEGVLMDLKSVDRQIEMKKTWNTWDYIKSVPGRIWGTIKAHPYISTAVVLAAGGAALYASGYGVPLYNGFKDMVVRWFLGAKAAALGESAAEAAGAVGDKAAELGGKGIEAMKDILPTMPAPEAPALPDFSGIAEEVGNAANDAAGAVNP